MKKLLTISLTALILFGASASVSWWLHKDNAAAQEPAGAHDETASGGPDNLGKARQSVLGARAPSHPCKRAAARTPYSPAAEEAVQLANGLRDRLAAVRERENQLSAREKQLEMIYEDIKGERSSVDALRQQLSDELKAADDKIGAIEQKRAEVEEQGKAVTSKVKEMEGRLVQVQQLETGNVQKMAEMINSMAPETPPKYFNNLRIREKSRRL